jgi:hypothetical protein
MSHHLYIKKMIDLFTIVTWLILPVVICLSQRLSHACLSINVIQWNCDWLIKSVIVYLIVPTTWITVVILELIHAQKPDWFTGRVVFIRWETNTASAGFLVNHNNFADRMVLHRRRFIQISALSTFDGRIEAYHGFNGWRRIRVRFRRGSLRDGYHFQGRQQARKLPNPDTGR